MSQYSVEVDQYVFNILQPEIDRLNVSLSSMEDTGYSSKAIIDTITKLNKLVIIYDFLSEYALGEEEINKVDLDSIMAQIGNQQAILDGVDAVGSFRDSNTIGVSSQLYPAVKIYNGDKLLVSNILLASGSPEVFKIYGDNNTAKIDVTIRVPAQPDMVLTGDTYVIATNVIVTGAEYMSIEINTFKQDGSVSYSNTIEYTILSCGIDGLTYWVGTTNERFSISSTDIDETSDITIDPNSGTVAGTVLDFNWLMLNFEAVNEFIYTGTLQQRVITEAGNTHVLIVVPIALYTSNLVEDLLGSDAPLVEGLHYDSFSIFNGPAEYVITYLRDLSSFTFQTSRDFGFNINSI